MPIKYPYADTRCHKCNGSGISRYSEYCICMECDGTGLRYEYQDRHKLILDLDSYEKWKNLFNGLIREKTGEYEQFKNFIPDFYDCIDTINKFEGMSVRDAVFLELEEWRENA